jgi:hypothetical protein
MKGCSLDNNLLSNNLLNEYGLNVYDSANDDNNLDYERYFKTKNNMYVHSKILPKK